MINSHKMEFNNYKNLVLMGEAKARSYAESQGDKRDEPWINGKNGAKVKITLNILLD